MFIIIIIPEKRYIKENRERKCENVLFGGFRYWSKKHIESSYVIMLSEEWFNEVLMWGCIKSFVLNSFETNHLGFGNMVQNLMAPTPGMCLFSFDVNTPVLQKTGTRSKQIKDLDGVSSVMCSLPTFSKYGHLYGQHGWSCLSSTLCFCPFCE